MLPIDPSQSWVYLLFLFFVPPIIAVIKQAGFSTTVNALIAQAVYVIVGIGAAVWSGIPVNAENAVPLIAVATVVGQAAYKIVWANLGKNGDDPNSGFDAKLTAKTSLVKPQ